MTASIENIVQHLFHQPSLQDVPVDELQRMAEEHPSFGTARFLLLKKMQDTNHPDFNRQLQQTAVYFNNPLWLQLMLSPQQEGMLHLGSDVTETELLNHGEVVQSSVSTIVETHGVSEDGRHVITQHVSIEETEADDAAPPPPSAEPLVQEVLARLRGHLHEASEQEAGHASAGDTEPASPLVQEVMARLRGQVYEAGTNETLPAGSIITREAVDPLVQEVLDRLRGQIHDAGIHIRPAHDAAELPGGEARPAEWTPEERPPHADALPLPAAEAVTESPVRATPPENRQEPAPPSPEKIIIETPMAQQDLLFEPYHTIDYFASQGILVDKNAPPPQDKLGRQLKSFTEWLKSMKRLPQASIEKVLSENDETAVVAAASHSIEGKEVITEAMAEVFEKQGLYEKAISVYRKLSLLNPAKSAYFADRINALKH